jgi:hypothetical protein
MAFDFDAAVAAPFRMQPGLRRLPPGATHLSPLAPGSRHQREKLAVLTAWPDLALRQVDGFDAGPALKAVCAQAAQEHPAHWQWDGQRATAPGLGVAVDGETVLHLGEGAFGLGDELSRCLRGLAPSWRLTGLLQLAFAEDLAVLDGTRGTLPWLAVALPSFWAPAEKVGQHFAEVHAPVADNTLLLKAADSLVATVTAGERWERFVWTVTPHPRLHAHPLHVDPRRWSITGPAPSLDPAVQAWFRTERQTFLPVPGTRQAVFTIRIDAQPLGEAAARPERARALHEALATMSPTVLAYRGLEPVRDVLLAWLERRAVAPA